MSHLIQVDNALPPKVVQFFFQVQLHFAPDLKNSGLKKFFIGRDHAGVNNFYKKDESQKFLEKKSSLKIEIFKTKEPIICLKCSIIGFRNEKFCKNDRNTCKFSSIDGKFIKRQILLRNFKLLKNYLNAEIIKYFKNKTKIF